MIRSACMLAVAVACTATAIAAGPPKGGAKPSERLTDDQATDRAARGAVALKKAMRDPDSFKLESALIIEGTNAVCYDYRSRNGFGGMNRGHAVLSGNGKLFRTSEMDGFSSLWNRECANKSGREVGAGIRMLVL